MSMNQGKFFMARVKKSKEQMPSTRGDLDKLPNGFLKNLVKFMSIFFHKYGQ